MVTVFGRRFRLFRPRSIWIRSIAQVFFFALIALISINHTLKESGQAIPFLSNASLHALCPFGGVVSIYQKPPPQPMAVFDIPYKGYLVLMPVTWSTMESSAVKLGTPDTMTEAPLNQPPPFLATLNMPLFRETLSTSCQA